MDSQPKYAGFLVRLVAAILDGILLLVVDGVVDFPITMMFGQGNAQVAWLITFIVNFVINYGYAIAFLVSRGATPGKMLLGIKVVTVSGEPLTAGRAALREILGKWLSALVIGLGYLWVIWDAKKQAWHDKIANTYVVYGK